jgi:O-antigen ligase/polysaccharide polymerase Wzy-like membrane protein
MSKARRKTATDPGTGRAFVPRVQAAPPSADAPVDPFARVATVLILGLVVLRWLIPTESAADGETLWIVELWFAAAAVWAWSRFRSGNWTIRLTGFDAALWVIVAGHVISTAVVFRTGGNRRAALNMSWEWIGLGLAFFLLRQIVPSQANPAEKTAANLTANAKGSARQLALIVATVGIVLAGLGIWQHYVYYPHAYAEYQALQTELEHLRLEPAANARRIGQIEFSLQSQGVPSEKAGREQFESRLRFSSEPFGPFALANTFAGFLFVALILAADLFVQSRRPLTLETVITWGIVLLLLLYCLVLTKSRTAWIGLVVAVAFWGACLLVRGRFRLNRRTVMVGAAVLVVLMALFAVAALGRGFDMQVLTEAPKSLDYRLQYWKGAMGVVREHPVFGVGPGNFRQHYLRFKLPQSSEEIADPHNLILDLWTSGGLLALIGFAGCLIGAIVPFVRRRTDEAANDQSPVSAGPLSWSPALAAATTAFLLAVLAPLLSASDDFDAWQLVLFGGWLVAYGVLRRQIGIGRLSAAALGGAALGLIVHLLGAGGIEMPAVVQLFLVLAVLLFATLPGDAAARNSPRLVLAFGIWAIVLFVCCLLTAWLPVLNRRALIASGDQALLVDGDADRAIADFAAAALRDPLSSEPTEKLAEAYFARWQARVRGRGPVSDDFAKATQSLETAIQLDPNNPRLYRRLGAMDLAKFARSVDRNDAQAAVEALGHAADRYPNDASLRAMRATAFGDAGRIQEAKGEAERALALDQINRENGHTDRYLPDETVRRLQQFAAVSGR